MRKATPDERWAVHAAWMMGMFNGYFEAQLSLGYSLEEAVERLRRAWAREDAQRMRALAEGSSLASSVS